MAYAEEKGIEKGRLEGRQEGLDEGRSEERLSNARKMKAKGLGCEIISDITGLTLEEIDKL